MSRRSYDNGALVEEWDDENMVYRRFEDGAPTAWEWVLCWVLRWM